MCKESEHNLNILKELVKQKSSSMPFEFIPDIVNKSGVKVVEKYYPVHGHKVSSIVIKLDGKKYTFSRVDRAGDFVKNTHIYDGVKSI